MSALIDLEESGVIYTHVLIIDVLEGLGDDSMYQNIREMIMIHNNTEKFVHGSLRKFPVWEKTSSPQYYYTKNTMYNEFFLFVCATELCEIIGSTFGVKLRCQVLTRTRNFTGFREFLISTTGFQ